MVSANNPRRLALVYALPFVLIITILFLRLGDIRGGPSVTIPMSESDRVHAVRARTYLLTGLGLWVSIVVFIVLLSYVLSRKVAQETPREHELNWLKAIVALASASAHEIRQPLTVLIT